MEVPGLKELEQFLQRTRSLPGSHQKWAFQKVPEALLFKAELLETSLLL